MTRLRLAVAVAATALLAGCGPHEPQTPEARADTIRNNDCRQHLDEIYGAQHRSELYTDRSDMVRDSPFSSTSYVEGVTSNSLSDQSERDSQFADCLRQGTQPVQPTVPPPRASGPAPK